MIITLPLIASLLFILSQATEFKRDIDFDRCNKDTACYVRQTCLATLPPGVIADPNVLADFVGGKGGLHGEKCDAAIQIKAFTLNKFHVMMRLESDTASLDTAHGFGLFQNQVEQMKCTVNDQSPKTKNPDLSLDYTGLQPNPDLQADRMFCSFFITASPGPDPDNKKMIASRYFNMQTEFPQFIYQDSNGLQTLKYEQSGGQFWLNPKVKCNGDDAKSADSADDFIELIQADTSKTPITCDSGQKLRVKYDGKAVETDQLDCEPSTKWSWKVGSTKAEADLTKDLEIGCIKNSYCTKCVDPPPACDAGCTTPTTETTPDGCKILKCPDNSFVSNLDNTNVKLDNGVECKKNKDGVPAWFIDTNADKEVTKLSCRTTIPCNLAKLKEDKVVKCPEDREGCEEATIGTEDFSCPDGLKLHKGDEMFTFKCDKTDGKHNAGDGPIYCAKEKSADATGKEEAPSGANAGLIAGIAVPIVLIVLGGLGFLAFRISKKRKAAAASKGAPASSTKASNKKSSEQSKSKSAEVKTKDKKESGSDPIVAGDTPKEPAKVEETPKDKVETPGVTPATTAPTTPATPATPAAPAAPAPAAAPPKSNSDDQTANAPV